MNKTIREDLTFGIRSVIEAIKQGKTINKILLQKGLTGELIKELLVLVHKENIVVQKVPIQKLNHMVKKNHQGVIAMISPVAYHQIDWLVQQVYEKGEDPFILILDRVKDVRNFGAIARTAECFGVHAIVIPIKNSALITNDAIKTSAGALFKIPICKVSSLNVTVDFLKGCGLKIFSCTEKSDILINKLETTGPKVLIMGSEEDGVDSQLIKASDVNFKIPMIGRIASLNVSVACGIAIHKLMSN
ncbi:MAG: 23S rRNA (guanosine(2251)-2'-O)-methyltransferase RlmB [Crocinitomicaceae bacterium]|nr:23S rRNA (guanosine(2251)-2'-O)-methyltransferase RlmB [Crocinitomicaceae bacterium]|tara:strand:- start:88 stop:825 length:738 start_codon:yes stop_codon:yes gene_type:complete